MKNNVTLFTYVLLAAAVCNWCEAQLPILKAPEPISEAYSGRLNFDDECPNSTMIIDGFLVRKSKDLPHRITMERLKPTRVVTPAVSTRQMQPSHETVATSQQDRLLAQLIAEFPAERRAELIVRALVNARQDSISGSTQLGSTIRQDSNLTVNCETCGQVAENRAERGPDESLDQIQVRLSRLEDSLRELHQSVTALERHEPQAVVNPFCLPRYSKNAESAGSAELPWAGNSPLSHRPIANSHGFRQEEDLRLAELQGELSQLEQMVERASLRISHLMEQLQAARDVESRIAKPEPMNLR